MRVGYRTAPCWDSVTRTTFTLQLCSGLTGPVSAAVAQTSNKTAWWYFVFFLGRVHTYQNDLFSPVFLVIISRIFGSKWIHCERLNVLFHQKQRKRWSVHIKLACCRRRNNKKKMKMASWLSIILFCSA